MMITTNMYKNMEKRKNTPEVKSGTIKKRAGMAVIATASIPKTKSSRHLSWTKNLNMKHCPVSSKKEVEFSYLLCLLITVCIALITQAGHISQHIMQSEKLWPMTKYQKPALFCHWNLLQNL